MLRTFRRIAGRIPLFFIALLSMAFLPMKSELRASSDLDRLYALESVAALRSSDNSDGLFAEYVKKAMQEYFSKQTRFLYVDFSKADSAFVHTKVPYSKVIYDNDLLTTAAQSLKVQTLIRTKIVKQGTSYEFTLEWLHAPRMEVLASESFTMTEQRQTTALSELPNAKNGLGDITPPLSQALDRMIVKVPFSGHITGRDQQTVTVNMGALQGIRRGDILTVSTLEEARRHPLLNTVVDWRFYETGTLLVEQVDEGLAFCKIVEEIPGRQLMKLQKITQVRSRPQDTAIHQGPNTDASPTPVETVTQAPGERLGWVGANLWTGLFSRSLTTTSTGKTGSGFLIGARLDGQFWVTKLFFLDAGLGYAMSTYGQTAVGGDVVTSISGVSALRYHVAAGASYLVNGTLRGPIAFVRAGFRSFSTHMPNSPATEQMTGPSAVRSVFVGFGGDLPLKTPTATWGALLAFDLGVVKFVPNSDVFPSGDAQNVAELSFTMGGYYRLSQKLTLQLIFDIQAHSFKAGDYQLDHKFFALQPSATYHF
jgi:hypothetical protein